MKEKMENRKIFWGVFAAIVVALILGAALVFFGVFRPAPATVEQPCCEKADPIVVPAPLPNITNININGTDHFTMPAGLPDGITNININDVPPCCSAPAAPAAPADNQPTSPLTENVTDSQAPVLFDGQSCEPEENPHHGCSWDVGVNRNQIGVGFGYHISWPEGNEDADGGGCDLVVLNEGWYEDLNIEDGRVEIYTLPSSDPGWIKVLVTERASEQAANYGCPDVEFDKIPQWDSPNPSPPIPFGK